MSRYRFIGAQRGHHSVRLLCQLVQVPASGYYTWQQLQQQAVAKPEPAWETALAKVFGVHKRCYGTRRLRVELRRKATASGGSACAPPCVAEACTRSNPKRLRPAPRTPRRAALRPELTT